MKPKYQISNIKYQIRQTGFTLLELLVVIGIIGVLAAIVVPNFMGARERSRDVRRKSDIRQIQKAMEMYKDDQSPPAYPIKTVFDAITCGEVWSVGSTTYMNDFPCDPLTGLVYIYDRNPADITDSLRYQLYACLENKSDQDGIPATALECTSLNKYQINEP